MLDACAATGLPEPTFGELGQKKVSGQLNKVIRVLVREGLIEYTISDKPNSRLQKYRLMAKGNLLLQKE